MNVENAGFILWDVVFCVCSRVFIHSLICIHDGQWLFSAALLQLTLNCLNYLFLKRMLIKLPFSAEDVEGKQWGWEEGSVNGLLWPWSSNCQLEAGGLFFFFFFWGLKMPGEVLGCRALIAFQRKAETPAPALARCRESGTGAKKLWLPKHLPKTVMVI